MVFSLNRGIERAFQTGVIGKAARRDAQELTGSWVKALRMQESVAHCCLVDLTRFGIANFEGVIRAVTVSPVG